VACVEQWSKRYILSASIFLNAVIIENNYFHEVGAYRIGKNEKETNWEEGSVEGTGRKRLFL
jgi:hypothetical protein